MREWRICPVCWGRGRLGLFGQYKCYECDGSGEIYVGPDRYEDDYFEDEEEMEMEEVDDVDEQE